MGTSIGNLFVLGLASLFLVSCGQSEQVVTETFVYDRFEKLDNDSVSHVGQMWREVWKRSQLECAAECLSNLRCFTFRYRKETGECQLFNSTTPSGSTHSTYTTKNPHATTPASMLTSSPTTPTMNHADPSRLAQRNFTYFKRVFCENGGNWNQSSETCRCVNGYIGRHCDKLMTDCSDGYISGQYHGQDGIFSIQPPGYQQLQVRCIMKKHGRLIIQSHISNNASFNQTWENFKNGFGLKTKDFWLGNDHVHMLTKAKGNMILAIEVQFSRETNTTFYYRNFSVSSEAENYRIRFKDVRKTPNNSTVNDCIMDNINASFSTWDNDHSVMKAGCAGARGGWWYRSCNNCSLNGLLSERNTNGSYSNNLTFNMAAWRPFPVVSTRMQIYYTDNEDITF